jgi:hypothetical protein
VDRGLGAKPRTGGGASRRNVDTSPGLSNMDRNPNMTNVTMNISTPNSTTFLKNANAIRQRQRMNMANN